jgi:hypothetical protein
MRTSESKEHWQVNVSSAVFEFEVPVMRLQQY